MNIDNIICTCIYLSESMYVAHLKLPEYYLSKILILSHHTSRVTQK